MMYGKVFDSLWKGSMRVEPYKQLVFIYMICNCDQDGNCDFLPNVIADDTGLSLSDVEQAIVQLQADDPMSRTPDEAGRRIILLSETRTWGWRIVNHALYRDRLSEAWKKERNAERQRKHREKLNSNAQKRDSNAPSVSASASASSPEGDAKGGKPTTSFKTWTAEELLAKVKAANTDVLLSPPEVCDFVAYWMEPTPAGRSRMSLEKTWDTRRRMQTAVRMVFEKQRQTQRGGGVVRRCVAPIDSMHDRTAELNKQVRP